MPTYSTIEIPGQFTIQVPGDPEQPPVSLDNGVITLTATTTPGYGFSYDILSEFDDGIPLVDIEDATGTNFVVAIDGVPLGDEFDSYIGTIFWGAGNVTQILTFEYENPLTQQTTIYGFVLGGTPVTDIVATVNSISGFSTITSGPFAPGETILLGDLPGAVETTTNSIDGTGKNDIIEGSDDDDVISGLGGDDTLFGNDGIDVLEGRAGSDTLRGGSGSDLLEGGSGADFLLGGGGEDTATYISSTSGVSVNLATGAASGGHANGDMLVSIEGLIGSRFADALTGSDDDNVIFGGRGGDTLRGGRGNDVIEGGGGGDRVLGGSGIDTASYLTANGAISLNLTTGVGTQGNANGDTFASIENVQGSAFDDTIIGSSGTNSLSGGFGDDALRGSAGNDFLEGGAGADFLNGGSGIDTVTYISASSGVALNLASGGSAGDADGDTFFRVENVIGSSFDDLIRGDDGDNAISGGRGDDMIRGGRGDDTITGARGNDTMWGGGGGDTFVFRNNNGEDMIIGFNTDADTIRLAINGLTIDDLAFEEDDQGLSIDYGTGTVTLDGLSEAVIDDITFVFG